MAEAASSHEDLGQIQDQLRRVRLGTDRARHPHPAQGVGRLRGHVKAAKGLIPSPATRFFQCVISSYQSASRTHSCPAMHLCVCVCPPGRFSVVVV